MQPTEFLDGVRIITMAQNVPGPLAAARLRQAGARVIKIEPPAGDPFLAVSPAWHAEMHDGVIIERLDLKSDAGIGALIELLGDCDVFLTSQRPSALARLGLDPDTLRSRVPQLRMLRILGSVRDPELPGHDLTYQAQSGLLVDATPRTLAADVMASERVFSGVLAVLRQPPGTVVDVGLIESLEPMLASLRHGLTSADGALGGAAPRYRVYPTSAGHVAVAALESHFEARLYEELGLPAGSDPSPQFLERTSADWEAWARERGLPIVAVQSHRDTRGSPDAS